MKCDHKVIRATNLKAHICMKRVALIGGRLTCQLEGNIFFGKVYYGQVVVQHVFQCEASKHTAKAPCCGWLTGSRERCGAWWGQIQVIRCSILDHVLTATVIWGLLLFILIMLNIITKEISSNNEWRCRLADSSHSEFITCLFYYALLTKPPPVHHQLSIIILQMWSSSSLLSILSWASVQGL